MRFRKKPVVIEAVQLTDDTISWVWYLYVDWRNRYVFPKARIV